MKRPQQSATPSNLLSPFSWGAWLTILSTILLIGPVIYLITVIKHKMLNHKDQFNFWDYVWFVYGAILRQGSTMVVKSGK